MDERWRHGEGIGCIEAVERSEALQIEIGAVLNGPSGLRNGWSSGPKAGCAANDWTARRASTIKVVYLKCYVP